ncbi:MAG: hypothetical protein AAFX87_29705 [Bacteroidota bacterium]
MATPTTIPPKPQNQTSKAVSGFDVGTPQKETEKTADVGTGMSPSSTGQMDVVQTGNASNMVPMSATASSQTTVAPPLATDISMNESSREEEGLDMRPTPDNFLAGGSGNEEEPPPENGSVTVAPPAAKDVVQGKEQVQVKEQKSVQVTEIPTGFEQLTPDDNPILKTLENIDPSSEIATTKVADEILTGKEEEGKEGEETPEEKALEEAGDKPPEEGSGDQGGAEEVGAEAEGEQGEAANAMGLMAVNQEWIGMLMGENMSFNAPNITDEDRKNAPADQPLPNDHELSRQTQDGSAAADVFLKQGAMQAQAVISAGYGIRPRIQTAAEIAKAGIQAKVVEQQTMVTDKIKALKAKVRQKANGTLGTINGQYQSTANAIKAATGASRKTVKSEYDTALKNINKAEADQLPKIDKAYTDGAQKFKDAGVKIADIAKSRQTTRSGTLMVGVSNVDDNPLDGPYKYNKQKAKSEAAMKVGEGYYTGLKEEGEKKAGELLNGPGKANDYKGVRAEAKKAKESLSKHYNEALKNLDAGEKKALDGAEKARNKMASAATKARDKTIKALEEQEKAQLEMLTAFGVRQEAAIDRDMLKATTALEGGVNEATFKLLTALQSFKDQLHGEELPDPMLMGEALQTKSAEVTNSVTNVLTNIEAGIAASEQGIMTGGDQVAQGLAQMAQTGVDEATELAEGINPVMDKMTKGAIQGFTQMTQGHAQTNTNTTNNAVTTIKNVDSNLKTSFTNMDTNLNDGIKNNAKMLEDGLRAAMDKDMLKKSEDEEKAAAAQVQPRWKGILKWVIIIAVVLVVALVVGPAVIGFVAGAAASVIGAGAAATAVGAIVGGAIVGAAAGGVIQMGHNLVDGKAVLDGVGKAMVVGAIGGALGGAGGALGQVITKGAAGALPALTRFGVDMVFDVGGGILGDLAVGNPITWEGVLKGAAMGAGMSVGMGGMGAIKGKFGKGGTSSVKPDVSTPKVDATTAPKIDTPAPKVDTSAPKVDTSAPKVESPAAPKTEAPSTPKTDAPSTPKTDAPSTPKTEAPTAPKSEAPAPPKIDEPTPPKTPEAPPAPKGDDGAAPKQPKADGEPPSGKPKTEEPDIPKSETPEPKSKGSTHPDAPEIEPGTGIVGQSKVDGPGNHKISVTKDGKIIRCSTCAELETKYAKELSQRKNAKLKAELEKIKLETDPNVKAKKAAALDKKLQKAEYDNLSDGAKQARDAKLPDAEPGYHWVKSDGDVPVYAKDPLTPGNQRIYDQQTGTFKDRPTGGSKNWNAHETKVNDDLKAGNPPNTVFDQVTIDVKLANGTTVTIRPDNLVLKPDGTYQIVDAKHQMNGLIASGQKPKGPFTDNQSVAYPAVSNAQGGNIQATVRGTKGGSQLPAGTVIDLNPDIRIHTNDVSGNVVDLPYK